MAFHSIFVSLECDCCEAQSNEKIRAEVDYNEIYLLEEMPAGWVWDDTNCEHLCPDCAHLAHNRP